MGKHLALFLGAHQVESLPTPYQAQAFAPDAVPEVQVPSPGNNDAAT
jgi:hypothetical protein